jgi:hypothetical protein
MGCDGCPLFPTVAHVMGDLIRFLQQQGIAPDRAKSTIVRVCRDLTLTGMQQRRKALADRIVTLLGARSNLRRQLERRISSHIHCYAATLHLRWAGNQLKPDKKVNKGLAPFFEKVTTFRSRMLKAAQWPNLKGTARVDKPW